MLDPRDVIDAIDDHSVRAVNDLFSALERYNERDAAVLTVLRKGQREKVNGALEAAH